MFWRRLPPAHSPVTLRSLASGLLTGLGLGPDCRTTVDDLLRSEYGAKHTVLTDSGTSALRLAMEGALKRNPGRVAIPAYSCYDISSAAEGAGAEVVLYDLDPASLGPDMVSLEEAAGHGTTAIVIAHLFGVPVDMREVGRLATRTGQIVIEDAAQGIGASLAGLPVGSFGDVSVLSFARGKGMTGGAGGAFLGLSEQGVAIAEAMEPSLADGSPGWRELTRSSAVWLLGRPPLYGAVAWLPFLRLGETLYREPKPPRSAPRTALGTLEANYAPSRAEADIRARNARRMLELIEAEEGALTPIRPLSDSQPGYLRLPVLATRGAQEVVAEPEARRLGVMQGYPQPLNRLASCRARCSNCDAEFAGAERLASQLITIPTHSLLRERHHRDLRDWVQAQG